MPHEKEVGFIRSESDVVEIDSLNNLPVKTGFIFFPYTSTNFCKPLFIEADKHKKMSLEEIQEASLATNQIWDLKTSPNSTSSYKTKKEYCKNIANAVESIKSGELEKVVLSRLRRIKNTTQNPLQVFHKLCAKYPAAFVSLVYIPGKILWITATPELLVSANDNKIETVSLAGTKQIGEKESWDKKEIKEQQIVTDYINEILKKHCSNIDVSGPQEIIAGNIKHLKTSFSATLNTSLGNLLSALHPTPAVCGIPLEKAKQLIKETEGYERKYYTGFLGPCNIGERTDLFVNLRCAELFANEVNLYIGGGITKDSIPEKEWKETELKSKTLLFAFEENEKE
jgi:isochorismate synthase